LQTKKKRGLNRFYALTFLFLILVFGTNFVSAARLPSINGDSGTWGTVLNEFLNVSLNDSGYLRPVSQLSFTLGGIIDNLVSGWIKVNGNLNVTGEVIVNGTPLTNLTFNPIVGYTTSSYDGNITNGSLNGYTAANAICASEYSGSHFCLKSEVLKTIANGNYSFSGTAWFQNGPPGYTANADDCSGWTTDSSTYLGPFWNWDANSGAGKGALTNCAQSKQLMCCGGSG